MQWCVWLSTRVWLAGGVMLASLTVRMFCAENFTGMKLLLLLAAPVVWQTLPFTPLPNKSSVL